MRRFGRAKVNPPLEGSVSIFFISFELEPVGEKIENFSIFVFFVRSKNAIKKFKNLFLLMLTFILAYFYYNR